MISISLSPNTDGDDILETLRVFVNPASWKDTVLVEHIEQWFRNYLKRHVFSFNSGRSALYAILKAYGIKEGDEVIAPAFTCVAVPNAVLWAGATARYADIDSKGNIDPVHAEKLITKKTRAIIVQHTFGIPAQLNTFLSICRRANIFLIEDCAHALGGSYQGKPLGAWGDASMFSFGRDKVLSSVFGGAAALNETERNTKAIQNLGDLHRGCKAPDSRWIAQQLFHPLAFSFILPLYESGVGKLLLYSLQRLGLLSVPIHDTERRGGHPKMYPQKYAGALAMLLMKQLTKLDAYNSHRYRSACIYYDAIDRVTHLTNPHQDKGSVFLRYPVLVQNPTEVQFLAKRKGIQLGNWYHNVIDPSGVDYRSVGYRRGDCPVAESYAKHILNLPTRVTDAQAHAVVSFIQSCATAYITDK